MNRNKYRVAFFIAAILCVVLLALLLQKHRPAPSASEATAATTNVEAPPPQKELQAPLTPVQLSPERMQAIGVTFGTVARKTMNEELRVSGNVDVDERRLAYVQTRFPGWIRNVFANATYQYVRKGEPLFTIYSPDLVNTEQEYLLARTNQAQLSQSSVEGVATGAASLVSAARARLEQWEIPQSEIKKIEDSGKPITNLSFISPASGFITERNALPNLYVQPDTRLYTIADLSTVWVNAQVFQTDIGKLKPGDPANITVDSYPGKKFPGRIEQILPQVDMNTRTARVRLAIANRGFLLKPGMFVNVAFQIPMGLQLVVPASAVVQSGDRHLVFVNHGKGNLDPREVKLGARVGDDFIVMSGLKEDESVATSANFLIDSESQLQAAAGAYAPPPPGVGGNAPTMSNQPQQAQANVEFSTSPSPPRKGANVFRVKLTKADGSPVTGAQVEVIFYMAGMPAMGMAAMKTDVTFNDKGAGNYEGTGELGSGGNWQVTVTARLNGQLIASKQFTLDAQGGM